MSKPTITLAEWERLLDAARDDEEAAYQLAPFLGMDFWGDDDDEGLTYTDLDEYLEAALDRRHPQIPEEMTVWGFRRMRLEGETPHPDWVLGFIYESLDDDYNGGDDPTEPPAEVKAAAEALCALVRKTYVPWNCDQVVTVTLDRADVQRKLMEFWPDQYPPPSAMPGMEEVQR